ncbi:GGDEF domain-containing protein [Campylobacter sp. MG1]|uniref:GGDEF domain-containing protein n=1 Tax=Campylobacter sp. MG1 TaxID=2976332 RepID=UPI00226C650F|nr:GGDEF domain-containing protein [Campylobacter sp. MG1]
MGSFLENDDIEVAGRIGKFILLIFTFVYFLLAVLMLYNNHIFPACVNSSLALIYAYSYRQILTHQINSIIFSLHIVCILYAIFMVFYFGWSFGAQYFIIPCIAFCYVGKIQSRKLIYSIAILEMLIFELLYFFMEFKKYSLNNIFYINSMNFNVVFYITHSFIVCVIMIFVVYFLKVRKNRAIIIRENINELLRVSASTDPLTHLLNRWAFMERIKFINNHQPIHFALVDIDFFKKVNDTYGHNVGDEVLKTVAILINERFSKYTDMISRWGGEEFLIFAHSSNIDVFYNVCEEFRQELSNKKFAIEELNVSVSIGCMHIDGCFSYDNFDNYMKEVDKLLYLAKNSGRNRIERKVISCNV